VGQFSFKSVGTTQVQQTADTLAQTPMPVGIKTPLALGTDDLLAMNTDVATQMGDNLRNLILTNWGERLGFYAFGANLRPLMSDMSSQDDFDSKAIVQIKNTVQTWMPYIDLQSFDTSFDNVQNKNTAIVHLTITYDIPSLKVYGKSLQVTLYAM